MKVRNQIKQMIADGEFCQHRLFAKIYPTYVGHYAKLRDLISEVKNDDANSRR